MGLSIKDSPTWLLISSISEVIYTMYDEDNGDDEYFGHTNNNFTFLLLSLDWLTEDQFFKSSKNSVHAFSETALLLGTINSIGLPMLFLRFLRKAAASFITWLLLPC